jgi:aminopeptidase-like protein
MLSKHGLYPTIGGSILPDQSEIAEIDLRLWTMFHSDGRLSIEEMADRIGVDVDIVRQTSDLLMSKGLLDDA